MKICKLLITLSLCSAVPAYTFAQPPQGPPPTPTPAVVAKGRAPVSSAIIKIKQPKPSEVTLANGLRVMVLEDRRAPQVTMQLIIRGAGGYYDPAGRHGLAMFTAANLREGTTTRTAPQIAEAIERMAAALTAGSSLASEDAVISASALTEHVDPVLDLMADILLNPTFPDKELDLYKTQMRAQLTQQRTQPGFLARERYSQLMMGDHPDSRVAPSLEAVEKATREEIAAFHKSHYAPDYAIMAIAGDISMADAKKKIEARLSGWKKAGVPLPQVSDPAPLKAPGIQMVARPNSVQTTLLVGAQTIRYTDPDFFSLEVMNKVIGGGPTGRLFRHLREDKGYTYGAGSNLQNSRYRATWTASTDVRSEVTEPALKDLLDEVRQLRETPVPDQELADAKRSLIAAFALTLESPQALLANALTIHRYGLTADYWERYIDRIAATTAADVQKMANKYLAPNQIQIVAVGSAEKIGPVLSKLGTVESFDAEGKAIKP